uniref:Major capsid protein n=1 Tax=Dulem virus 181 TaxID=3145658 RepID=A0AAU8AX56_9VIRU
MAKGYRNTLFTSVKTPRVPLNRFDLSFDRIGTFKMGKLYPIICKEMLPGDRFRVRTDSLVRTMPLSSPAFGRLRMYIHYFFVPNRLVWDNWEDFITGGESGQDTHVPPFISWKNLSTGNLSGYVSPGENDSIIYKPENGLVAAFGLPVQPASGNTDTIGKANGISTTTPVSVLPFRAYRLIWNEYYRDQNVDDELPVDTDVDGEYTFPSNYTPEQYRGSIFGDLLSRRWLKDYFTSALPTPQRGPDVQLPIVGEGGTIQADGPLKLMIQNNGTGGTTTTSSVFTPDLNVGLGNTTGIGISSSVNDQFPVEKDHTDLMYASGLTTAGGSVVAATINDLRRAIALQRFYEISARAGSRYIETIMGHFHVRSSDARLQRPEYLGGGVTDINIGEVLQTSATDQTSPQGNMAGRGFGVGRSNQCTYRAEEHGYLFGIMSIIPEPYYFQGIDKDWTRQSRVDYYWPSFAHLGEQEIDKSELCVGDLNSDADQYGKLFGYAPRYAEYKFSKNIITGLLRGSLANWTFARSISSPNLNAAFLEVPQVNNPFAVQDEDTDKFIVWFSNEIRALRPMPFFGTPSI